ncbi:hypothetical protein PsYK624_088950 [Phanerochaete sordida]|uniref:Uncharacterized protein n=1 Tax=Phanerochaete sordida TaxID=48140 RepID=A0A9P3LFK5_9APHY|nr:hypothetical protein PsYK624_088950 [Phanerochaete sordida]
MLQYGESEGTCHPILAVYRFKLEPVKVLQESGVHLQERPYKMASSLSPLPDLPPKPPYPSLYLRKEHYEPYLKPLYERMWRVITRYKERPEQHFMKRDLYFGKHMVFREARWAEEFVEELNVLMNKAVHHGHVERVQNNVFYATNTHSALRNPRSESEKPGITLHDVRVAIRAEKLWEKYHAAKKATVPAGLYDPGSVVESIQDYALQIPRKHRRPGHGS